MDKFDIWNEQKKITHKKNQKIPDFDIGQIWWVQLGKNIASEALGKGQDFLRPVLVLQKLYGTSALVIPLTTQKKSGSYYTSFVDSEGQNQTALLAQIRYIDGRRLSYQLSKKRKINKKILVQIQQALFDLIKNNPRQDDGGP